MNQRHKVQAGHEACERNEKNKNGFSFETQNATEVDDLDKNCIFVFGLANGKRKNPFEMA